MTTEIQDLIKFSMVHQVLTVYLYLFCYLSCYLFMELVILIGWELMMWSHSFLSDRGAAAMLHDPFMEIATREIIPGLSAFLFIIFHYGVIYLLYYCINGLFMCLM